MPILLTYNNKVIVRKVVEQQMERGTEEIPCVVAPSTVGIKHCLLLFPLPDLLACS